MWIITENVIEPKAFNGQPTSKAHSHDCDPSDMGIFRTLNTKFRLLDDDGNVYFEGLCDDDSLNSFAMLDDYGTAFGCTGIQWADSKHNNGSWAWL